MRGEIWGDHRMERRSDFLDKDDCETGEGDQDEGGRTPTQLLKMNAAATEKSVNSMSRMVFSYLRCVLLIVVT